MISGPQDASNAYVESRPAPAAPKRATGPRCSCALYSRWAERHGYQVEMIDELQNDEAGIRSATMQDLRRLRLRLPAKRNRRASAGPHQPVRFQRPPADLVRRRRRDAGNRWRPSTSTSSPTTSKRDTFRSGGPGGQHQNKTESGVRYTHLPTGVAAESRTERSQHKNDANAMALLRPSSTASKSKNARPRSRSNTTKRAKWPGASQIRNYVMQPYTLVKDVRTDTQTAQVGNVLGWRDRRIHPGVLCARRRRRGIRSRMRISQWRCGHARR